ncbi:serine/threonine protein phosphatase [Ralstonia pickettii]|uniref:Serine/threonine protein phosphatase n=1 Tax=Ralstonia pickettii TaxID=329 RepID=A0A2N4TXR8_RALPI|nr:metallophosphoesterase [Ralstonia pickettii]PLC44489.1 serine/threonine protein phosphatase [Ralstonia pickettii]
MKPYGIISDTHHHSWSAFSTTLPSGVNSRLQQTLDETKRCAEEVRKAGGNYIAHAGDLFHVRGSIAPSVLNPTLDCYGEIIKSGINIVILAGNHDLEGKEALRVSSAITALEGVGCKIINSWEAGLAATDHVAMIPWNPSIEGLKKQIEDIDPADRPGCDLILHAPVDGVIPGLPDHGLSAEYLAKLGFRRVFSGHYHHHKEFEGGVYSIGSLTPQTWSDVDKKSGFLIVYEDRVRWMKSHAPEFVEIDSATDPADIPTIVDGNYVKATIRTANVAEVESLRAYLIDSGAKGVVLNVQKDATAPTRSGTVIRSGVTLDQSVQDYIAASSIPEAAAVAKACQDVLTTVRSVA